MKFLTNVNQWLLLQMEKINEFLKTRNLKKIIKPTLSLEEQKDISNESKQQHKEFCHNLKNESLENIEQNNDEVFEIETIVNDSDSEVSDFSEIDEYEVIDCSNYIRTTETDEEIKIFFKKDSEKYQDVLTKKEPDF